MPNREILFKSKHVDNGKWVEGFFYQIWEKTYILWGITNNVPNMIEVIPKTVCEYTGLTDKNGTKIFEWDIVEVDNGAIGYYAKVYFDDSGFYIVLNGCGTANRSKLYEKSNNVKVIGNVFDNPELLEGTE